MPETFQREEELKTRQIEKCSIRERRGNYIVVEIMGRQQRFSVRQLEEQTAVFQDPNRKRSGFEMTNSGLKNRLELGR
jgi:hypothetical protein